MQLLIFLIANVKIRHLSKWSAQVQCAKTKKKELNIVVSVLSSLINSGIESVRVFLRSASVSAHYTFSSNCKQLVHYLYHRDPKNVVLYRKI